MKVLHLIDGSSPQAAPATLAMLAAAWRRTSDIEQHLLLVGGSPLFRQARALDLHPARRVSAPLRQPLLATFGVLRLAQRWFAPDWETSSARQRVDDPQLKPDLVHCWSIGAFNLAALIFRRMPRLLTLTTMPSPRACQWLRLAGESAWGTTIFLPISATIAHRLLSTGVPAERVHVLRPGLDLSMIAHNQRPSIRREWGVEDPTARVVALLSDPPWAADCRDASMTIGLVEEVLKGRVAGVWLVVHPEQLHRNRIQRQLRDLGRANRIIVDPRLAQPWSILPGCDAALSFGPQASGLSMLWAMASNVPIVAQASYATSEILEDRHSALLSREARPKNLAHRLTTLLEDQQLMWKLRDTARHEAYSYFSRSRYVTDLSQVYTQMAQGRAVEVPGPQATGGLRFAGRA